MAEAIPFKPGEHKGALYQLKTNAPEGAFVTFAGTMDKYGQVWKHQDSGYHLIRGLGFNPPPGIQTFYRAEVEN